VQWTAIATIPMTMITADAPQIPAIIATEKKLCKTIGNCN